MSSVRTGIAWRLFLTCWIVYSLHFATDFVREHYLVVAIAEDFSFQLDEYHGLHPDIFRHDNGHAYHGANPGISMIAAIPYAVLAPGVNWLTNRELERRAQRADTTAVYDDPRPARREFYQRVRARGLDIKFGMVGLITLVFCMAPLTAWSAVVLYRALAAAGATQRLALGGALLYAFGTPVFFRTAYLSQNLAVGIFGFVAFVLLWNPGGESRLSPRRRRVLAGLLAGGAFLCDYSGLLVLGMLGLYAAWCAFDEARADAPGRAAVRPAVARVAWFVLGAVPPVLLLWFYQWAAFGHAFYPPQHHMPPVEWIDLGYQGVTLPQPDLVLTLLFDPRFGLLVTGPVLALAALAPWVVLRGRSVIPTRETTVVLALSVGLILFFGGVQYTRLQYITGIRYLVPVIPFLMLAVVAVLARLPRWLAYGAFILSVALNWGLAMERIQTQEPSIVSGLARVYLGGLRLPAVTTLRKMSAGYSDIVPETGSPLPIFLVAAAVIVGIWTVRRPGRPLGEE